MSGPPKYLMSVDLSVLESLGINLYSNAAAVLSELVANAWDADATKIDIAWSTDATQVVVSDDGSGMSVANLNERFLKVGYQKRSPQGEGKTSPRWKRAYMGRKGIGKLSVFSIAELVEVYSTKDGVSSGLSIDITELRNAMNVAAAYHPAELQVPDRYRRPGTTLILKRLTTKRAGLTASALRKRLARRFALEASKSPAEGGFSILVNGSPITFQDRQELKRLEYIWEFGSEQIPDASLPSSVERFVFSSDLVNASEGWRVSGWIGTAKAPSELTDDEEAGSLKNIIVLARNRPIQEGIIEKLDFSRLFGNYVTGQVQADFLDLDDHPDIATSDRQRLIEDDTRVVQLQKFLRERFLEASEIWAEARPKRKSKDALAKFPELKAWVDNRPQWQRPPAEKMIGTIAGLEFEGNAASTDRNTLFRSGVLAFERVGLRESLDDLKSLTSMMAVDLLPVLAQQDSYEDALYIDILRSRLQAITSMRGITKADQKEAVLQRHLFGHLWLLDASWERSVGNATIEEDLRTVAKLHGVDEEETKGRIDIRYQTAAGKHLIVELKRYSRKLDIDELAEQGSRYALALKSILVKAGVAQPGIEVVFVIGQPVTVKSQTLKGDEQYIKSRLEDCNGRIVYYDELIRNSQTQYQDYLDARDKATALDTLLSGLESLSEE